MQSMIWRRSFLPAFKCHWPITGAVCSAIPKSFRLLSVSPSVQIPTFATSVPDKSDTLRKLEKWQVEQYEDDGYVVVNNVLSQEEINKIKAALDDFNERSRHLKESNETFDIGPEHCSEKPQLRRVVCPSKHHPTFYELQRHPVILDIVEDLLGPDFRYMPQEKLNLKPPGKGSGIPWHQDWAFFPHTNDSVLTVSVILDDSYRDNGCLQVIPKSHKGPLFDHFQDGVFANCITDEKFDVSKAMHLEAPAGSVTVHNAITAHGSAENISNRPRRVCCYIFNAMDAWPLLGVAGSDFKNVGPVDFDLFNATKLRGKACHFPRLKSVPVCLPIPFDEGSTVYKDKKFNPVPQN